MGQNWPGVGWPRRSFTSAIRGLTGTDSSNPSIAPVRARNRLSRKTETKARRNFRRTSLAGNRGGSLFVRNEAERKRATRAHARKESWIQRSFENWTSPAELCLPPPRESAWIGSSLAFLDLSRGHVNLDRTGGRRFSIQSGPSRLYPVISSDAK